MQHRTETVSRLEWFASHKVKGQHAVEAHILRRVYANIRITDFDNDETTTNVAVAFHQKGIQIGFGPNVMICHNQCMLSPELYMSSYSEKGKKGSGMEVAYIKVMAGRCPAHHRD